MPQPETVASPCIMVCSLDEHDVCIGCYRSLEEIGEWPNASDARKREIVASAEARSPD